MMIQDWETSTSEELPVREPVDIIALRMEVRQKARRAGMGLVGQSSIALAASNLAYKVGLDRRPGGQVKMSWQQLGSRVGVRLVMTIPIWPNEHFVMDLSDDIHLLVDKIEVHTSPENVLVISMVKWGDSSPARVQ